MQDQLKELKKHISEFEQASDIYANDIALFKNEYIMGWNKKQRRIAFASSLTLLMGGFFVRGQFPAGLRAGFLGFWGLGYVMCPEIYNWALYRG